MGVIALSEPMIAGNEWRYIKECLDTGWVSSVGSFVDRFERTLADYTNAKHAVAVMNGTAALHLALLVSGVRPEDEVLVPTLTFIAPVNTVRYVGAHPVFFDCDPRTLCLDVQSIGEFLTSECEQRSDGRAYNRKTGRRVSAAIAVDVFGHPVDMDPLMEICRQYSVEVIEDATESLGSQYKGRPAGMLAEIGCLSFNGNKIITTGGGGMLLANNEAWAKRAKHLSTQAKRDSMTYDHDEIGYNYRLTNIQAAMGVAQLEQLPEFLTRKREIAETYRKEFAGLAGVELLWEQPWVKSNFWLCAILVASEHRDPLLRYLNAQGIEARPVWKLIHTMPMYRTCQTVGVMTASTIAAQCLNIPSSADLSEGEQTRVITAIKEYLKREKLASV